MHFHLPKPLHGWRAFAGEVAIIVLGVLIALGGEQLVEHFHQRSQLREAEQGMVAELRDDDLPQAYTRAAIYNCYADQLDKIENAVASGDRAKAESLARAYHPVIRTWDEEAWKAAMNSQVLVSAGARRMTAWSSPYVMIPALANRSDEEQQELPHLWARVGGTGPLSTEQQDRMFDVVSLMRRHNQAMAGASLVLMRQEARIGLTLTGPEKAALLAEARKTFGDCTRQPSPDRLNMKSQLAAGDEAALGRR